jgi:hypothetical protein
MHPIVTARSPGTRKRRQCRVSHRELTTVPTTTITTVALLDTPAYTTLELGSRLQASPDYAAIRYQLEARKMAVNTQRQQVGPFLDWIKSNGGIPSLAAAHSYADKTTAASCTANWSKYGSQAIAPDPRFVVDHMAIQINGPDGLNKFRTVISAGSPISFGTHLYKDFHHYYSKPSVYVGGGALISKSNGKPDGHLMLIIGYDDSYGDNKGAVRLQNSWGTGWGDKGYAWVAYDTLEKLVDGTGFYAPESA